MPQWLRSLFGKGVPEDPNALAVSERKLLTEIVSFHFRNIGFISLIAQLNEMLMFSGQRLGGVPDWLRRRRDGNKLSIVQARGVGDWFAPPPRPTKDRYDFPVLLSDKSDGFLCIQVGESIDEITISVTSLDEFFSDPTRYNVGTPVVEDEHGYWQGMSQRFSELQPIPDIVQRTVERQKFEKNVIVPVPMTADDLKICGVIPSETYRRFLAYSNGIRINELVLSGDQSNEKRLFEEEGHRYVRLGFNKQDMYYAEVRDSVMQEEVLMSRLGSKREIATGKNVIEICRDAVK